ncbi:methyltransferase domain-containing protein [Candidatus Woesearchaeota archaeon]|nr:MAG: methyltransferase domain-containing protein [Candidatus Woesearchaeota archaeon]
MGKVLIKKEKKEFIPELNKTVIVQKAKKYLIEDTDKDYATEYGIIAHKDFSKDKAVSSTGKEFFVLEPEFIDYYKRIKRLPQTISLKDIGTIITTCGINKNSIVAESGTGSAGLTSFLAMVCKKVHSYDIEDAHLELSKKTLEKLKIKNVVLKKHDIYKNFPVKNVDVVCLDVPEPWHAVKSAMNAVKKGGFIVSYSPCITQSMEFVEAVRKEENLLYIKTVETIERAWKIEGKAVRPKSELSHSAFISFVRRLG